MGYHAEFLRNCQSSRPILLASERIFSIILHMQNSPEFPYEISLASHESSDDVAAIQYLVETVGDEFEPPISQRTTPELYTQYLLGKGQYLLEKWGVQEASGIVVLAHDEYSTVGLAACYEYLEVLDGAYLICTMVHPNYRRQGIAERLMEERLTILTSRGVSQVHVTTWSENTGSVGNIEKAGFTLKERKVNGRGIGGDDLLYVKSL